MNRFFRDSVRRNVLASRLGSLILLFQRSPIVQLLFPEVKILGSAGLADATLWTVTAVAGLGAFDSVSGATSIVQVSPVANSNTVPATAGSPLSFVFQLTNYPDTPGSWKVTGLPAGLTHADAKNNTVDSVAGVPTQAGTFSVVVRAYSGGNYSGDSFSKTFTMNVAAVPASVKTNPASVTINSGQTTTLTVAANGTAPFTYKWYQGNSGVTTTPVGTNSPSFTTPALTSTTKYWVKVSNSANTAGDNSTAATVTVNQPAVITGHPASVSINSGQSVTLNVTAGGTAPLTYKWYQGNSGVTTTPVGTNSPSFTTPALTTNTSYWVKVTNVANSAGALSNTATVSINQPAAITAHPQSITINSGQTTTLNVTASGTAPLAYQWYEGESGVITNPVGTNSPSFMTPALTANAVYWVKVTNIANSGGALSDAASISVNQPAAIATPPSSVTINSGESTLLSVLASGTGPFTYQWYEGASGVTTQPVGTDSPSFTTPVLSAGTAYWVRVTNAANPTGADSPAANVTVLDIPAGIAADPVSLTINQGESTVLSVIPSGTPPFSYQWYEGDAGNVTTPVGTNSASFTTPSLNQTTSYWVRVKNNATPAGVDSKTAVVTVSIPVVIPAAIDTPPTSVTINTGESTVLHVAASGTGPLLYQWYQGAAGDVTAPVGTNAADFTTPVLTADSTFWVNVSNAANPLGVDSPAALISVNQPAAITVHPASATIVSGDTATLTVTATGTGPLVYQWYEGSVGVITTPVGTDSNTFITPVLSATRSYWVKVTNLLNSAGADSESATVEVVAPLPVMIGTHPASVNIPRGESTTLHVNASGTGPLSYQWYRGIGGVTTDPVGGNSADFTTPAMSFADSYWVRVTNRVGSSDSQASNISLLPMLFVQETPGADLVSGVSSVNFGTSLIAGTATKTLTVRNAGVFDLTGISASLSGANPSDFTVTGPVLTTLPSGQNTTFEVTFSPAAKGARSASLQVISTVAGEEPFVIQLTGNGLTPVPEISIVESRSNLSDGKSKISFGTVKTGKTGTARTFTIKNTGSATLTGFAIKRDGTHAKDFLVTPSTKTSLAPGKSTTFKVAFKPAAKGSHSAAIHIKSNDSDENPFDIKLSGAAN